MVLQKDFFDLPAGMIYLDGNSLGPLPKTVKDRVAAMIQDEWGTQLIKGWNTSGWMAQPSRIGDAIGRLIGAPQGTVVIGDTLSIKVFQAVAAAIKMRPDRRVILSDSGNFPTDLYMVEGLIKALDSGYELRVVAPEDVASAIDDTVAVVMLTEVDYRTGRMHEMGSMTKTAHEAGAVMIWDLAHSAGAVPVDLEASGCEFAIGCTYKYLNGGPGAPAFIYVRKDLADDVEPALAGWLGHDAPFAFDLKYRPARGIERMRVGTPPVLQMAALDAALAVWEGVDMAEMRSASIALQETFIHHVESRVPQLTLASPRDSARRGSQVSFAFENGYAAMQALIARGVIGDFRAPDIMRFGFTPLYIDEADVIAAVDHIEVVMKDRLWDDPKYLTRQRVT
ncbi:kynureninase [Tateyamaria pelophila]|uniref:kynureninase n=1 Tax=Tateyamaria pelophila TaxID=328415 RepID=UPI001CBEBA41|nr:kynureninase [Tateyamaria pelophila]